MATKEQIGLDRISPSMLMCYNDCPRNFYYSCWLGLKLRDENKMHMTFGTAVHETLDYLYLQYDRNFGNQWGAVDFDDIEKFFKKKWTRYSITDSDFEAFQMSKKGLEYANKEELWKEMLDDGIGMLKAYWEEKDVLLSKGVDILKTEIAMRIPMRHPVTQEELAIPLSLRIDATTVLEDVAEFKTSGGKYDEEETREKLQGRSYAFAQYQEKGKVPKVHYIILLKGKKRETTQKIQHIELNFDVIDMIAYWHRVEVILQKISNREFERSTRGHPPYCDCYKYEALLDVKM